MFDKFFQRSWCIRNMLFKLFWCCIWSVSPFYWLFFFSSVFHNFLDHMWSLRPSFSTFFPSPPPIFTFSLIFCLFSEDNILITLELVSPKVLFVDIFVWCPVCVMFCVCVFCHRQFSLVSSMFRCFMCCHFVLIFLSLLVFFFNLSL